MLKQVLTILVSIIAGIFTLSLYADTILKCPLTPGEVQAGGWEKFFEFPTPSGDQYQLSYAQIQTQTPWGNLAICLYQDNNKIKQNIPGEKPALMKTSALPITGTYPKYWTGGPRWYTCNTDEVTACSFTFINTAENKPHASIH